MSDAKEYSGEAWDPARMFDAPSTYIVPSYTRARAIGKGVWPYDYFRVTHSFFPGENPSQRL